MDKPFVFVSLLLHGNEEVIIRDYVDDSGRFIPLGTQAVKAIEAREQIHYVSEEGVETIIPFHAITNILISKATDEYVKPEDAFCQPIEDEPVGATRQFSISGDALWWDNFITLAEMIKYMVKTKTVTIDHNGTEERILDVSFPTEEGYGCAPTFITDAGQILFDTDGDGILVYMYDPETTGDPITELNFTINTEKMFVGWGSMNCRIEYLKYGFYDVGESPVFVSSDYTTYSEMYPERGDGTPWPDGGVFPAVTNDIFYEVD